MWSAGAEGEEGRRWGKILFVGGSNGESVETEVPKQQNIREGGVAGRGGGRNEKKNSVFTEQWKSLLGSSMAV